MTVTIHGIDYECSPELAEVVKQLYDEGVRLNQQVETMVQTIANYQMKNETAVAHPTRETRLQVWKAKKQLLELIPKNKIEQLQFFRA